jgi:hypothetical protein
MTRTRAILLPAIFSLSALASIAAAQPENMNILMLGHASLYKTPESFSQVIIGDPKIVDVAATSDQTATITALMTGTTNVIFVNARGEPVLQFEVVVQEPQQSRVRIYNKPSGLIGNTAYRCGPTFCDYVEETITKEPQPERPTVSRSVTTNSDGSSSATTTTTTGR